MARSGQPRPLDVLDRAFRLLVCEPAPLALDGMAVGHDLPARLIPLDRLRQLLLDPSVGFDARDGGNQVEVESDAIFEQFASCYHEIITHSDSPWA